MKTKTITHIATIRTDRVLNAVWICETFGISELDYKTMIYDLGMNFLDNIFGFNTKRGMNYACTSYYWQWFKSEHLVWESDLIQFIQDHRPRITTELYTSEMEVLIHDRTTQESFNNFLKFFNHKSI